MEVRVDQEKKDRLERAGWKVGNAEELLGWSEREKELCRQREAIEQMVKRLIEEFDYGQEPGSPEPCAEPASSHSDDKPTPA